MLEKDYIMRFIQSLFDTVNKIINSIDINDINDAKMQIDHTYGLLGNDKEIFLTSSTDQIILFLKSKEEEYYLKKVNALSQLLYLDANIETSNETKAKMLQKVTDLISHFNENSTEFSLELNNLFARLKEELR